MSRGQSGTSLLETVAALAIASVLAASSSAHAHRALAELRDLRIATIATTVARNRLEAALGAPCGQPPALAPCPSDLLCSARTTFLGNDGGEPAAQLLRVAIEVAKRLDRPQLLAQATAIVVVPSTCIGPG